jgi:hypothetical protein
VLLVMVQVAVMMEAWEALVEPESDNLKVSPPVQVWGLVRM